jgi:glycosyltransferase involved in cell wall biosynthesis
MLVIVIPTKNRRVLLERALASVFSQGYMDYRVVVINDGSTDGTREYLDSLENPKTQIVHHDKSRGVNVARNTAYRELQEGEWAVPLDDDDLFLPGAFETIAVTLKEIPMTVSVVAFNTIIQTRDREYVGGREYQEGELSRDFSYTEIITGDMGTNRGEPRCAYRWTLFPKYLFAEDINGFEGEWWLLVARDGIGIRYVNTPPIVLIDWRHEGEHLGDTASRQNPGSFARAHDRIFRAHRKFFATHPEYAADRAIVGLRVALRALDPVLTARFGYQYLRARRSLLFRGAR